MVDVSPQYVWQELLQMLRDSNLHFLLTETPHSAQIMLRKRFLKDAKSPAPHLPTNTSIKSEDQELKHQNNLLHLENQNLLQEVRQLRASRKISKENVEILEQKVAKAEAAALRTYEGKNHETCI